MEEVLSLMLYQEEGFAAMSSLLIEIISWPKGAHAHISCISVAGLRRPTFL